jgi:hypothetical protein
MPTKESLPLIIAFVSLVVSILSLVYAREAHKLDVAKFEIEQQSREILLDFTETIIYQHGDYTILETTLQIRNNTFIPKRALNFSINLYFGRYRKYLFHFAPMMTLTAEIWKDYVYPSGLIALYSFIDKYDSIRMVVLDAESKERVRFSPDEVKKIDPPPISYLWEVYTIIPRSIIYSLASQNAELNRVGFDLRLYPLECKTKSSSHFLKSLGPLSDDILSRIFPNQNAG